jgi:glycosyltransferase involved in cell wall biosynthesis
VPLDVTPISDYALPLKLIEYTGLGLPSITVRSTAIRHYLRPDECLFFTPGDVRELAALLDRVATHPEMLESYRRRLPVARERMSWTNEKRRYVAMLHDLAGHAPAGVSNSPPRPGRVGTAGSQR